ncbi:MULTISPECIES: hypothetical protein [Burkholderia]|uniref:Uncharacterized protein n=1 Tax=Burkholderia savannae TaxID=1637837 RepID=A0ABR5TJ06_9BURK|nr:MULTISPECIES: hypothetical protein [Burkholderia]AOJ70974.1 hypothetical protein WS78_17620 [Burkholderia savannae]AOJ82748.1 hypothetical protein WS86_18185 [Burkholderia savannae]KGS01589.1 hypothetical protein X946_948 [Burkholderia sp. ABCPW 111]KVG47345.1 hypothetical protein WS77_28415 [Burkholderia sp. MSMB0265]KVG85622.1 hypothetical protein WS81_31860 [Burkholderia sp. MSMB2040]
MPFRLTSRLHRTPKSTPSAPPRIVRALRHHSARASVLAERARQHQPRLDGLRAWLHAFLSLMSAHAAARRIALRSLLQKPSLRLRAPSLHRASAAPRRINRPRRLAASTGWFVFAAR